MTRKANLAILAVAALCAVLFAAFGERIAMATCPFKWATGYPCPGCGGTRAALMLLHGNFTEAVKLNPLSVAFCIFLAVSFVWIAADTVRGRDTYWRIYRKKWSRTALFVAVGLLIANWVWNIVKGV